ncbi:MULTISPECIES: DUF4235 domain-containing protein [Brevibacterium]|nr:DUF4235 domain-containing protein [Brevibacterium casei]
MDDEGLLHPTAVAAAAGAAEESLLDLGRKDTGMGKLAWQIIGVGAPIVAAVAARKVLTFAWEKSTHRPAPSNPVDEEISMSEALAWTVVSGVGVAIAQLVVQRLAANTVRNNFGDQALPKKFRKQIAEGV